MSNLDPRRDDHAILLAVLIESGRRFLVSDHETRNNWLPGSVRHPDYPGFPFTDRTAWRFIAERLRAGDPLKEVTLTHPPGARAYVLLVKLTSECRMLYIKVELRRGRVIGRSFHYSSLLERTRYD